MPSLVSTSLLDPVSNPVLKDPWPPQNIVRLYVIPAFNVDPFTCKYRVVEFETFDLINVMVVREFIFS